MSGHFVMMTIPGWLRSHCAWFLVRYNINFGEFAGSGRSARMVRARELCVYLLRHWKGPSGIVASFPEITMAMGRHNHSTIMTQYKRCTKGRTISAGHSTTQWCDLDDIKPAELLAEAMESDSKARAG